MTHNNGRCDLTGNRKPAIHSLCRRQRLPWERPGPVGWTFGRWMKPAAFAARWKLIGLLGCTSCLKFIWTNLKHRSAPRLNPSDVARFVILMCEIVQCSWKHVGFSSSVKSATTPPFQAVENKMPGSTRNCIPEVAPILTLRWIQKRCRSFLQL